MSLFIERVFNLKINCFTLDSSISKHLRPESLSSNSSQPGIGPLNLGSSTCIGPSPRDEMQIKLRYLT